MSVLSQANSSDSACPWLGLFRRSFRKLYINDYLLKDLSYLYNLKTICLFMEKTYFVSFVCELNLITIKYYLYYLH